MSLRASDIPGARLCRTPAYQVLVKSVDYVVSSHQVACVTGPVGVGKATGLRLALEKQGGSSTWLDLPTVYNPKDLIQRLYRDIVGDPEELPQRDLQDDLMDALATGGNTVVINNAERLTREAAGQLEWLHSIAGGWSLYLVGLPNTSTRIASEPHLRAALAESITIGPLSTTELHVVLPSIHDLFFSADKALINAIDTALGGNLGNWMQFLHRALHMQELQRRANQEPDPLNQSLASVTLAAMRRTTGEATKR